MICLSRVDVWTYWFSVTDWSALYTHTLAGNLRSLYIVQLMVLYKYVCAPLVTVLWLHVLVYKIHNLPHSRDWLNTFGVILVNIAFLGLGGEGCSSWIVIYLSVVSSSFIMVYVRIFSKQTVCHPVHVCWHAVECQNLGRVDVTIHSGQHRHCFCPHWRQLKALITKRWEDALCFFLKDIFLFFIYVYKLRYGL